MRCGCLGWFESTMLFDALYFISTIVIIKLSKRSGRRCLYAEKNKEYIERIRTMYEKCVQRRFLQKFLYMVPTPEETTTKTQMLML